MNIRHAKHYEPEERTVLIRYNPERSNYYWCNVNDGDVHGSTDSNYVAFTSLCDCIDAAKHFGYEVIVGDNCNKQKEEKDNKWGFPVHDSICLVDGCHGIYVPQRYAVMCTAHDMMTDQQRQILEMGPHQNSDLYWEVWDEVLTNTKVKRGDSFWHLDISESGDVLLVRITD